MSKNKQRGKSGQYMRQKYLLARQPADGAHAFDYAAPLSAGWMPAADIPAIPYTPEEIIPHLSQFITLKTGDYIFINTSLTSATLHPGDRLLAFLNGKEMLKVEIR
ncbi:MAG: fumarylacetoacetate hydrolase family protein [Prevotellaceae bacterium]|jgi:hypothetical protein|nr:fumarylacetoacetate hydrolase family protein [Prevotellaceae bacterium]